MLALPWADNGAFPLPNLLSQPSTGPEGMKQDALMAANVLDGSNVRPRVALVSLDCRDSLLVELNQTKTGGEVLIARPENPFAWSEGECLKVGIGLMQDFPHRQGHLIPPRIRAAAIGQAPHAALTHAIDGPIEGRGDGGGEELRNHRGVEPGQLGMTGLSAEHQRRYGEVKTSPAGVPDMQGLQRAPTLHVEDRQAAAEILRGIGGVGGIKLEVERALIVGRAPMAESIGEDGTKVRLPWQPCHEVGAVGDKVPVAGLSFMLPVPTKSPWWNGFAESAGGDIVLIYGRDSPAQWPRAPRARASLDW